MTRTRGVQGVRRKSTTAIVNDCEHLCSRRLEV